MARSDVAAVAVGTERRQLGAIVVATTAFTVAESSLLVWSAFADSLSSEFSLSRAEVGLLASALAVPFALVQVPAGLVADAWGLNRSLALSLSLMAVGFAATAVAQSFAQLMAFRALTGFGAGMIVPVVSSIARASDPAKNMRNQGIVGSGWGLGYLLGLLVVPLAFNSWRAAFAASACAAGALTFCAFQFVPSARTRGEVALKQARSGLASDRTWLLASYIWGLGLANVGVSVWAITDASARAGVSDQEATLLASLIGWGLLAGSVVGPYGARRLGPFAILTSGSIGMAVAVGLLAAPLPLPIDALALAAIGWFTGFPFGVVLGLIAGIVPGPGGRAQGAVAGAINGFAFLGAVIAPPIVGAVRDLANGFGSGFALLLLGPTVSLAAAFRLAAGSKSSQTDERMDPDGKARR